jgi:DNA-binding NtrC family response regulator
VLLRGESGTGKELLAQELHAQSGRSGAFVPINCGSIPIELLSSELFGHTKQAFSGATRPRKGVFLEAAGGTLFLDEIGDCPMPIQVALLRALQEKAVRPVGAEREIPVDVRVIAATHRDLDDAIEDGGFRADLYARLAQISLVVPPLRERRGEVLELIELFAVEHKHPVLLTADAVEALVCWDWPLNVRELQALVQALIVRGRASEPIDLVRLSDLVPGIAQQLRQRRGSTDQRAPSSHPPDEASARTQERQQLRVLLEAHGGNVSAVAQQLGRPRSQIYRWLKAMGFSANKFRR